MYLDDSITSELIPHPCRGCEDFEPETESCKSKGGCLENKDEEKKIMIDTKGYNKRSLRPNDMTQENYSFYLGGISKRTIENWEHRGTPQTTWHLLMKIKELQEKVDQLEKKLKDDNMTFQL